MRREGKVRAGVQTGGFYSSSLRAFQTEWEHPQEKRRSLLQREGKDGDAVKCRKWTAEHIHSSSPDSCEWSNSFRTCELKVWGFFTFFKVTVLLVNINLPNEAFSGLFRPICERDENILRALSLSKFPITKLSMEVWFSFSSDTICFPKVITISA